MLKINYDLIGYYRKIGRVYILISVFLVIGAFLCFFINKIVAGVFLSILGCIFLALGYCRISLMKNIYQYIILINSGEVNIEKISGKMAVPVNEVRDDINTLISARIFLGLEKMDTESTQINYY